MRFGKNYVNLHCYLVLNADKVFQYKRFSFRKVWLSNAYHRDDASIPPIVHDSGIVDTTVIGIGDYVGGVVGAFRASNGRLYNCYVTIDGSYNVTRAGKNATIYITVVTDDPNNFTGDVTVRCDDLGLLPSTVHVVDGRGSVTFVVPTSTSVGNTYNVSISYSGSDKYVAASGMGNVSVIDRVVTVVTVSNATLFPGESVVMNVTLSDIDGNVLNGSVYIKELGQYVDVVDGKGSFDFIVPVNAVAGTVYGFVGNYSGSLDYYGSREIY